MANTVMTLLSLWTKSAATVKKIDAVIGTIHGIGSTEFMVLHQLGTAEGKRLRRVDLADAIGKTASGVTRLLAPMEKIGLVEKVDNPRDARVSLIKITEAGERTLRDATLSVEQKADQMLRHLSVAQLKALSDTLMLIGEG